MVLKCESQGPLKIIVLSFSSVFLKPAVFYSYRHFTPSGTAKIPISHQFSLHPAFISPFIQVGFDVHRHHFGLA